MCEAIFYIRGFGKKTSRWIRHRANITVTQYAAQRIRIHIATVISLHGQFVQTVFFVLVVG